MGAERGYRGVLDGWTRRGAFSLRSGLSDRDKVLPFLVSSSSGGPLYIVIRGSFFVCRVQEMNAICPYIQHIYHISDSVLLLLMLCCLF
jgi:hypothetical protein